MQQRGSLAAALTEHQHHAASENGKYNHCRDDQHRGTGGCDTTRLRDIGGADVWLAAAPPVIAVGLIAASRIAVLAVTILTITVLAVTAMIALTGNVFAVLVALRRIRRGSGVMLAFGILGTFILGVLSTLGVLILRTWFWRRLGLRSRFRRRSRRRFRRRRRIRLRGRSRLWIRNRDRISSPVEYRLKNYPVRI